MRLSLIAILFALTMTTIGSLLAPRHALASEWELRSQNPPPDCSPTPVPTPNPSPTPDPSPTPTPPPSTPPGTGGGPVDHTVLGVENLNCIDKEFVAAVELSTSGVRRNNIKVVFRFDGITKEAITNNDGSAKVTFPRGANGTLTADPEGFPFQSMYVEAPANCPAVGGQVLGATTLAATGSQTQVLILGLGGFGLLACTAALYGYFKRT